MKTLDDTMKRRQCFYYAIFRQMRQYFLAYALFGLMVFLGSWGVFFELFV